MRRNAEERVPETALVVLVPEADGLIGEWRSKYTEGGRRGMPAHVTLVVPWVPAKAIDESVLVTLRSCVEKGGSFPFVLSDIKAFEEGVLFLTVTPHDPFRTLIASICEAFPAYQPYGGDFAPHDVIPHVSVAVAESYPDGCSTRDAKVFAMAREAVAPGLPIEAAARELQVCSDSADGWRVAYRVPLTT